MGFGDFRMDSDTRRIEAVIDTAICVLGGDGDLNGKGSATGDVFFMLKDPRGFEANLREQLDDPQDEFVERVRGCIEARSERITAALEHDRQRPKR